MARIRIFQKDSVRVWFVDEGEGKRELSRVGGLPGPVDWSRTAETCRPLPGGEGVELRFVFEEPEEDD